VHKSEGTDIATSEQRTDQWSPGTTKVEQMDALYFAKFMLAIDQSINTIASLRLNAAIRIHLQNENVPFKADEKITKIILI